MQMVRLPKCRQTEDGCMEQRRHARINFSEERVAGVWDRRRRSAEVQTNMTRRSHVLMRVAVRGSAEVATGNPA